MEKTVFENFDQLIENIAPTIRNEVETSCMYRNKSYTKEGFDNFCKATTQENCIGCKFYSPDLIERRRLVLEYVNSLNDSLVDLRLERLRLAVLNQSLENENDLLCRTVDFYRTCGTGVESDG